MLSHPGRSINDLTIKTQLTLSIFAAILFVLGIATILSSYVQTKTIRNSIVDESRSAVGAMSQDFVRVVVFDRPDVAVDISNKLESFPHITNAIFYDEKQQALFAYNREAGDHVSYQPTESQAVLVEDDYVHVYEPIEVQGTKFGSVYFRLSTQRIKSEINEFYALVAVTIPVLLGISIFLVWRLQKVLSAPILHLAEVVEHIGDTYDYNVVLSSTGNREVAILYKGFNRMINRIDRANRQLESEKALLDTTLDSIVDGVITTDANGRITFMNPSAEAVTGYPESEAVGRPIGETLRLLDERTRERVDLDYEACLEKGDIKRSPGSLVLEQKGGTLIHLKYTMARLHSAEEARSGIVLAIQDISEARAMSQKLTHQASHDTLTDLLNRRGFEQCIAGHIETMGEQQRHCLMYVDVDQFKVINEDCGHVAGDALLKRLSLLLPSVTRESDVLARLGGDEFGVLLIDNCLSTAQRVAEKIRQVIQQEPFVWGEKKFSVTASIGMVEIDDSVLSHTELMRMADVACFTAKDLGRNRIHAYSEQDEELSKRDAQIRWVPKLNDALENDRIVLHAQRIQSLDAGLKQSKYEILVRMEDKSGQLVPPGLFIPSAERFGVMPRIDKYIIEHLFSNPLFKQHPAILERVQFSINLSGATLNDADFFEFLKDAFARHQISPPSICFEITETATIGNFTHAIEFISKVRRLGCEFSLDDFGSGLSSFAYLQNLPIDYLKIDGSFVRDIAENEVNRAFVQAINQIGKVMGIKTIAEFVEDGAILRTLGEIGIDFAQGYHVHKPAHIDRVLMDFLEKRPQVSKIFEAAGA